MSKSSNQKPSFSQKCGVLSRYLKEKGSFGELGLGLCSKIEFSTGGKEVALVRPMETETTTMDLFPQQSGFVSEMADSRPQTDQMTIFYGGKVIVIDNLSADRAKEVMLLASRRKTSISPKIHTPMEAPSSNPPRLNVHRPPQAVASDLPIARRASLYRFLEKRKDRVAAKPYQANGPVSLSPPPPRPASESKSWLGLTGQWPKPFQC